MRTVHSGVPQVTTSLGDTSETWKSGWPSRLAEAVRLHGHSSVNSLLSAMPAVPYQHVADRLGAAFAPIQIVICGRKSPILRRGKRLVANIMLWPKAIN